MLIRDCLLIDMSGCFKEPRDIRIENGVFAEIGRGLEPLESEEVIEAGGRIVTPGFVDPHCMVGLMNQVYRFDRNDANEESGPSVPQMRAIDAINLWDEGFEMMRLGGVTTAVTGPGGNNLIGGTYVAVKTGGESFESRVISTEAAFHFVLTSEPRQVFGKKGKSPSTRMGSAAIIRGELYKAKYYREKRQEDKKATFDIKYESLMRVFDGMLVKFSAISESDIRTAVRIAEEFGLNYTVDMAYDAAVMADWLIEHGTRCIIGSLYGGGPTAETSQRMLENGAVIEKSGLDYALMLGHPMFNGQLAPQYLTLLHKYGMSQKAALEGLTIKAARLAGIDSKVGSVESGKDADLLLWSGDPFDYYSDIDIMLIDGKKQ
ncbi:MAG: amidohydrolase family protein [Clostridiaceae bacterium]|nr:amidohydrolase family protein [Clostridiaceae bacterium]